MKKLFSVIIALAFIVGFSNTAKATHSAGGELIYELVPGQTNQYKFIFKFYRDCAGSPAPGSFSLCYNNTCGAPNTTVNMGLYVAQGGVLPNGNIQGAPVSTGCPGYNNTCTGGVLPGYQEWWYTGTVTLPTQCNTWKFWTGLCCRNGNIDNLYNPGSQNIYIEATLDNTNGKNINSSPYFSNPPIPFMCINLPYIYNNGAIDPDNDSLVFQAIKPRTGPTSCANVAIIDILDTTNFPYNVINNPFPTGNTFSVNSQTGATAFTATAQGEYVITIKVSEYRQGVLIGFVMRDIQIVVGNCNTPTPQGLVDTSTLTGGSMINGIIQGCAGDSLKFCFDLFSTNPIAVLVATDNGAVATPGANIVYSGTYTDSMKGCFTWGTSVLDTGLHVLTITIKDSSCQPPGFLLTGVFSIPININPITQAFGDTTMCNGGAAQLQVYGGSQFIWTVLPGGSPIGSLSCTNCDNPIATPTVTTSYVVTSNLASICNKNIDTVVVQVAPIPVLTVTPNSTTCVNADFQLSASAMPIGPTYAFNWTPATYLNNPAIPNPIAQQPQNTITYTVTVIPDNLVACQATATVTLTVLQGFDILNNDTTICYGDGVQINATGAPEYTYTWTPTTYVSNPAINNPLITPLPIAPANLFGVFPYTLTASYPGCPDSSQNITITVEPIPVVNAGPDLEMCNNDTLHLHGTVDPVAFGNYTYSWAPISDLDFPNVLDVVFDGHASTIFTLTATTPAGCTASDQAIVDVISGAFLTIDGDRTICPGESVQLNVYANLGTGVYDWTPKEFIVQDLNDKIIVKPISTTEFFVTGVNLKGCLDTISATVVVNPDAVLDAGDNQTIFPGESAQLYASGNCSFFAWSPPFGLSATDIKNPMASPSVTTRYFVTARTEAGCDMIDSVDVLVSPESIIELPNAFSPGSGTSINDELRIMVRGIVSLNSFKIFNRWGEEVFSTTDITKGWNGQYKGKPQPLGAYVYVVDAVSQSGKRFTKKGNVTLFR